MWPSDGMRPKSVVWATSMTPQSFYHAKPGSLSHRWVVAEERSRIENDDKAEATRALREMRAGRLSKVMKVGGEIFTCMIEQDRSPLWRARLRLECSRKTPTVASCFQLTNGDHKPKRSCGDWRSMSAARFGRSARSASNRATSAREARNRHPVR